MLRDYRGFSGKGRLWKKHVWPKKPHPVGTASFCLALSAICLILGGSLDYAGPGAFGMPVLDYWLFACLGFIGAISSLAEHAFQAIRKSSCAPRAAS